ncbi:hypothetical protein QKU48_gp1371 [Fadolivirus algeromassiliense]|jgi:hypothetical protein|uniref:Uncharacterized protein n=1 Tax=Fadolivirus FV1/VV64 TaxID=3070911 RepID=A0A7D3UWI0_9VIRU|nr:hypothetical protein QKU48_gp1371 [Fadolivirus algeromassiliense]QKF94829.1 hypothetical protein Fadolivirus_1_1371 [Fadolivirus FV1/VV64]
MQTEVPFSKWCKMAYKSRLHIQDIANMKKGDKLKVLVMDRNLCDIVLDPFTNPPNCIISPKQFFRFNSATYTHDHDLTGKITFHWRDDDFTESPFEFHIEYKKNNWFPLEDGYLPTEDPQGFSDFKYTDKKSWKDFPIDTAIGYRGCMVPWDCLNVMPNLYWDDTYE